MLQVGENLIINADDLSELKQAASNGLVAITCGLKLNSTITASSISDDGFTFCIQRTIYTLDKLELPPQEFNIKWRKKPDDIFIPLAVVTAMLVCGISSEIFKEIMF